MPIKMSKHWKYLRNSIFFFLMHFFVFESFRKKYFGLLSDWQIKTVHYSHNYLE